MKNHRFINFISLIFILFAFFFISSCAKNQVYSISKQDPLDESVQPVIRKVEFGEDLKDKLSVASIQQSKVSGNLTKIQIQLRNLTDQELKISYKIEWLNSDDMIVKNSSLVWSSILIRGGETVGIQSVGTSPDAINFIVKVQKAKNL